MAMVQGEFHTDCSLAPREKRILDRSINVYLQREAEKAGRMKIDEKVREYCRQNLTTARRGKYKAPIQPPLPIELSSGKIDVRSRDDNSDILPDSISTSKSSQFVPHNETTPSPSRNSSVYLPNEIAYQILSFFTDLDSQHSEVDPAHREYCSLCYLNTLYTCCLISRSWNTPATATLYRKLKLDLDGTCEYHWRGIPWGDGVLWWNRRTSYLRDRYLKLLLRTLTARPELAQYFRTVEIDLHHHLPSDYKVFPLYTKLISLCSKLTAVIGDPCIFFVPVDPYLESLRLDLLNYISRGRLHKSRQAIILQQQKKLWKVLSEHTAWESWEWIARCQKIQLPAFYRFHYKWKSLKHLSIKGLHYEPGNSPSEITTNPIACLDSLESLSLSNTGLKILQTVPVNKLTALRIELLNDDNPTTTFREDLTELWEYLSQSTGVTSRLRTLGISSKGRYASLTEKWLPKTISLAPNLNELSISFPYSVEDNIIFLVGDPSLETLTCQQTAFPKCTRLRKLSFLCPGWTHNALLLKALRTEGVFPVLGEMEYYSSTAIVERDLTRSVSVATQVSKTQGEKVDICLETELVIKRNFGKMFDASFDSRRIRWKQVNCK